MIQTPTADFEKLARDEPDAVEQVKVETVVDLDDRPADHFAFLVNQDLATQRTGLFRMDLGPSTPRRVGGSGQ